MGVPHFSHGWLTQGSRDGMGLEPVRQWNERICSAETIRQREVDPGLA